MATRIRLQRHGKKGKPIYNIVVADQRAPRDGKFIQKIGLYNPNTNPATINIEFDNALEWLMKGAQPSHTARAILSYKGILMKKHLLEGVKKGAFSEEDAEKKFNSWIENKNKKIADKIKVISNSKEEKNKIKLAAEIEIKEKRAKENEAKLKEIKEQDANEEAKSENAPVEAKTEESTEEAKTEEPTEEAKSEEPTEEAKDNQKDKS